MGRRSEGVEHSVQIVDVHVVVLHVIGGLCLRVSLAVPQTHTLVSCVFSNPLGVLFGCQAHRQTAPELRSTDVVHDFVVLARAPNDLSDGRTSFGGRGFRTLGCGVHSRLPCR